MPQPPLPPDFAWHPPSYLGGDPEARSLLLGGRWGVEVALVATCAAGTTWHATTNRHLPWERRGHGYHRGRPAALRMVERWAVAHATRLRAETALRRQGEGPSTGLQSVPGAGPAA